MKRFIRYLYEYEQGRRMRNVGFVKVDAGEEECVVHIHGKGLRLEGEPELTIYLFFERDGECIGIPQGVIGNVNPAVNYQLRFTKDDVGESANYPLIEGIIMENSSHRKYAAVWNDMPVNVDEMRLFKEADVRPEEKEMPADQENEPEAEDIRDIRTRMVEKAVVPDELFMMQEPEVYREEEGQEEPATYREEEGQVEPVTYREEESQVEPAAYREEEGQVEPVTCQEEESQEEPAAYQEKCEQEQFEPCKEEKKPQSKRTCTKIQRKDIASLPRCEWRLANNSFLLHGCYNYHHLVLIEEDGNRWLGVPGIYHPKEEKAAESLGFPQFVRASELDIDLEENEQNTAEEFGYWCRHIRR